MSELFAENDAVPCPCCANLGVLPPSRHLGTAAVDGEAAKTMCDDCLAGAFLGGKHPHAMSPLLGLFRG